jgi:hypothetical protein
MWPILDVIEETNPGFKEQAAEFLAQNPCY